MEGIGSREDYEPVEHPIPHDFVSMTPEAIALRALIDSIYDPPAETRLDGSESDETA